MANKPLKSITFPGLTDTYTIPQIDTSLTVGGKAADAQAVGNKFTEVFTTAGNAFPTDTASGSVASFADGADDIPMKSVVVNIEPVQSGSGDPSPDNVRPISGWTGAQVSHSGADRTNPTTYPITFPSEAGTVYGGVLDVTNGVLTVDRAMVDLGTLTWDLRTSVEYGDYFWGDVYALGIKYEGNYYQTDYNALCSQYSVASRTQALQTGKMLCFDGSNTEVWQIQMKDSDYSDATAFKTAMSGVQLCYQLATPITYHLTPTEIKSLLGDNNVWADAGDSTVEYRADTAKYIDKKIAEVINAIS